MAGVTEVAELLDGLNDNQRRAVTTDGEPLCIVAGAGSGKTRVLTRRIAHRCLTDRADPRRVLAVTFTRKAAGELRSRLRRLGLHDEVTAGTFHALAYAQLRSYWADQRTRPPDLLQSKIAPLLRLLPPAQRNPPVAMDAAGEIEWAKARIVPPHRYAQDAATAGRRPPLGFDEMADLYQGYEDEKERSNRVDFDDLLWRCLHTIERDPAVAASTRWRFRHLFVDEFQDVNPLQHRLLEAWRGDRLDLCVVGDPNQAIYSWNGADPDLLVTFAERFPSAEVVVLDHNYRSTPEIVSVANAVLASAGHPSGGRVSLTRLRSTRAEGRSPTETAYASDQHEARGVARLLLDRHGPGTAWSNQAVLFRTNAQAVQFEKALQAVKIPYRVRGRGAFIELPEVREALKSMSSSRIPFLEAVAAIEAGLPAVADAATDDDDDDDDDDVALSAAERDRIRNLQELLRLADEYTAVEPAPTAGSFRAWLTATLRAEDADAGGDAVQLSTFHAAKGLEWPIVHVAGLEDGLVPIGHARLAEEFAEERRLFYVAITRAQDELWLSWAQTRRFGSRTMQRSPSAYLDLIEPAIADQKVRNRPADWRSNIDREKRRLRSVSPPAPLPAVTELEPDDQKLFEALRQWRSETARAANVPAFVVFHDTTLRAIACAHPRDRRALLAVSGVGEVKASRFGDDVLRIVASIGER
jgi:DNA helicase-2/ATP-dependent DNA helicase PcrA